MWETMATVVLGPVVVAGIASIRWLFTSMESRLEGDIKELKAENKALQAKVDQMLQEAIDEQRALVIAYQKQAEASRQVSQAVITNTKVIEERIPRP